MDEQQTIVWKRLKEFDFNDGAAVFSFTDRLAKENNWSVQKTFRAVEAYRRFLFLAVTAGHPVSPPAIVDEVWHLHLLYTRNYWQKLCRDILQTELHHEPTRGGVAETAKFTDWYARTLNSYRAAFNEDPPPDLWPPAGAPGGKHEFRRIDMTSHYVLPKSRFIQLLLVAVAAIAILAFAGGWSAPADPHAIPAPAELPVAAVDNPLEYKGRDFISFYAFVAVLVFAVTIAMRWQARRGPSDVNVDQRLDPYAVAYLSESPALAVRAAIANLIATKRLTLLPHGRLERNPTMQTGGLHPLEEAILMTTNIPASPGTIERRVRPQLDQIAAGLTESRLLVSKPDRTLASLGHLLIAGTLLTGVVKLMIGLSRDRPVGLLLGLMGLTLVGWIILFNRSLHRTRAGDVVLARLRDQHRRPDRLPAATSPTASVPADTAPTGGGDPSPAYAGSMMGFHPATMLFALYGPSILMGYPELGHAYTTLDRERPGDTSGGGTGDSGGGDSGGGDAGGSDVDSGGDSGSSCSSGCGGCGGGGD